MNSIITNDLINDGFGIIDNCIDQSLINDIKNDINQGLIEILKKNDIESSADWSENFGKVKEVLSHYEVQIILSKRLINNGLISKIFLSEKLLHELILLIGPDIEYLSDFEIAINDKVVENDDYLIKKFHQEFWSGMGIEALQFWIPVSLLPGMGTIEIVKKSHLWGHIPHQNREPLNALPNYESIELKIEEGSVAVMSALTLHKSMINKHQIPRIAIPITVRNFYYPRTGNNDLFNFKKLNLSFFSKLRKVLGNPHYSPFRTLGQKRKDFKNFNDKKR